MQMTANENAAGILAHRHLHLVDDWPVNRLLHYLLSLQNRRNFLRILGEQRRKRGEHVRRNAKILKKQLSLLPSHATRVSRSPRFRLCSPKIRKNITPVLQAIICYTVLTRPNKVETDVHGCNYWLSVWTSSCRCPLKLST